MPLDRYVPRQVLADVLQRMLELLSSISHTATSETLKALALQALAAVPDFTTAGATDFALIVQRALGSASLQQDTGKDAEAAYAAARASDELLDRMINEQAADLARVVALQLNTLRDVVAPEAEALAARVLQRLPEAQAVAGQTVLAPFSWGRLDDATYATAAAGYCRDTIGVFKDGQAKSYYTQAILAKLSSAELSKLDDAGLTQALVDAGYDAGFVALLSSPLALRQLLNQVTLTLTGAVSGNPDPGIVQIGNRMAAVVDQLNRLLREPLPDGVTSWEARVRENALVVQNQMMLAHGALLNLREIRYRDSLLLAADGCAAVVCQHTHERFLAAGGSMALLVTQVQSLPSRGMTLSMGGMTGTQVLEQAEVAAKAVADDLQRREATLAAGNAEALRQAISAELDAWNAANTPDPGDQVSQNARHAQLKDQALAAASTNDRPLDAVMVEYLVGMHNNPALVRLQVLTGDALRGVAASATTITPALRNEALCLACAQLVTAFVVGRFTTPLPPLAA